VNQELLPETVEPVTDTGPTTGVVWYRWIDGSLTVTDPVKMEVPHSRLTEMRTRRRR
jgi:hypothetical protein